MRPLELEAEADWGRWCVLPPLEGGGGDAGSWVTSREEGGGGCGLGERIGGEEEKRKGKEKEKERRKIKKNKKE